MHSTKTVSGIIGILIALFVFIYSTFESQKNARALEGELKYRMYEVEKRLNSFEDAWYENTDLQ
jgi:hypothetical protein